MDKNNKHQIIKKLIMEALARGMELAIDRSIRTGVPLAVEKGGKVVLIPPKYKYVRVPIKPKSRKAKKKI